MRAPSGKRAEIFPATNDAAVLRAVLFDKVFPEHDLSNVVTFLIHENWDKSVFMRPIKEFTDYSGLTIANGSGGKREVIEEIQKHIH